MNIAMIALWLDTTFTGFDALVLEVIHSLAQSAGVILTPLLWFISFTGETGALTLLAGVVLLFFKKTRKVGICMLVAVVIGALFTNVLLKNLVARDRPFESSLLFYEWWQTMGAMEVSDRSFPSGHTTAATAGAVALIIASKKPLAWLSLIYVGLMALSRMYFVVHYPTDIIAGLIIGTVAAMLACWLVNLLHKQIKKRQRAKRAQEVHML